MADQTPPNDQATVKTAPGRSRALRSLAWIAAVLVGLALLLAALTVAAVKTERGTRLLWQAATRALAGKLSGELAGGTLYDGVRLRNLDYRDEKRIVGVDNMAAAWHLSLSPLKLTVDYLRIGKADLTLLPSSPTPMSPPQQIRLPLAVDLRSATARQIVVHRDEESTIYSELSLNASSDGVNHALNLINAVTPFGVAHASLQLAGERPFATSGTADLAGTYREERYRVAARVAGTLAALDLHVDAGGDKLAGVARIEATPFAAVPFRRAQVEIDHVNPRLFSESAPQADLRIRAMLMPAGDASRLAVSGPVSISNAKPGPLDKGLLPLASASADVTLDAQRQRVARLNLKLSGDATLQGTADLRGADGSVALQAEGLDLHALHTALKPTRLRGPLTVELANDTQRIGLKLADPSLSAEADAELTPQKIVLHAARLQAGPARLRVDGTLARDAEAAYAIRGELTDFDPALFIDTMKIAAGGATQAVRAVNARINMDFNAEGALHPEPSAKLRFDIHDSTYDGLPMTGGGSLNVAGKRLLPSDMRISIAGNEAALKGAFGAPSEQLDFKIDAPALARLGIGVSGLLQAEGRLGGTLQRPVVNASYRAQHLALGDSRLALLSGEAHIDGVPGSNPDARIALVLNAQGMQSGEIGIDRLNAAIHGTYANHVIDIASTGRLRGKRLALTLDAEGRLREEPRGLAWDGTLHTLENRGVPSFAIGAPLAVSISPQRLELGATRINIERAVVDLEGLEYDNGRIRSEGSFSALDVGHLLELQRQFTGAAAPAKTDLVLDGSWNFVLADTASGFLQAARRRGDVVVTTNVGETTLGLREMTLRADLQGDRVRIDSRIDATRVGSVAAQGQIGLLQADGRLVFGPEAPLSARVTAAIPRLTSIASLAGPRIALDGSVAIDVTAAGTLGAPLLSGTVNGDRLALTLFDQGVRLRDGTAHIALSDNIVELREVVFHGGDGTLRATGRIPLDQESSDLTAHIVADRLQLLAHPSARLTVSGEASAANINRQLQVAGKFTVDRALISLPEKSAPKLDDDVIVVSQDGKAQAAGTDARQRLAKASAKPAGPLAPRLNVEVDLGREFRFRGSGADLRLAGRLEVRSEPDQPPQAFGTVRVVDGVYEAFGAKLAIEHGAIDFQGPFDNPSINIVAMRREQEVAAGVQVTGTVQQPRVTLVSEPSLPDEEKLSWLVFGHGSSSAAEPGQAQNAAKGAALGLLNKFGGARVAKGLGLDQLSIGTSEFGMANQQVVNLGKEISNRLYVGYEQSLAGAGSVVKLTYELTRHWSVVVRGGAVTGMEMLYSDRFDRIAERSTGQR